MLEKIQKFFERNPKLKVLTIILLCLYSIFWVYRVWGLGECIFYSSILLPLILLMARTLEHEITLKKIMSNANIKIDNVEQIQKDMRQNNKILVDNILTFKQYLETTNSHTHHSLKNAVDRIDGIIDNLEVGNFSEADLQSLKKGTKNLLDALEIVKMFGKSSTQNDFPISELMEVITILHKTHTKKIDFQVVFENILPNTIVLMNWYAAYQVFDNLLLNAYQAIANQPKKMVRLFVRSENDNFLTFWVCDTGVGIRQEDIEKLFILGFTTKEKQDKEERGVGLHHIRQIITENKGTISYKGANTEFSTIFEIKLPIQS
jgi:signal transduction histidine kinase